MSACATFTAAGRALSDVKNEEMVEAAIRQNAGHKIVFVAGTDHAHQVKVAFLLGCHMIMAKGWTADSAVAAFKPLRETIDAGGLDGSVQSCWRALAWARRKGWIDFRETFDCGLDEFEGIQMDEYLHYARYGKIVWDWTKTFFLFYPIQKN